MTSQESENIAMLTFIKPWLTLERPYSVTQLTSQSATELATHSFNQSVSHPERLWLEVKIKLERLSLTIIFIPMYMGGIFSITQLNV